MTAKGPPPGRTPPRANAAPAPATDRSHPFAALEALRGSLPVGDPPDARSAEVPRGPARAVVRMERKGRGGKEVTVVEKLGLGAGELETWCRALKQALGCGGSVDGDAIVLQGDLRTRIPAVLTARGVAKVTVG